MSLVLEWENVRLSDLERTRDLLGALPSQAAELGEPVELLVVFDPGSVPADWLGQTLRERLPRPTSGFAWRAEPAPGMHYYQLKNHAARCARGEFLVMVDSDVIPDPGWLAALTGALRDDPGVGAVFGNTYIDPRDPSSKAFAAGWFFPLRETEPRVREPSPVAWANNCAFRREVFLAMPYPPLQDGVTRGACGQQRAQMDAGGVRTLWTSAAQVSHPAPNGTRHWFVRALAEGRDHSIEGVRSGRGRGLALRDASFYTGRRVNQALRRIASRSDRRSMRMSLPETPICLGLVLGYYAVYLAGTLTTCLVTRRAATWWRI